MKHIFGYSDCDSKFSCWKRGNLFYLKSGDTEKDVTIVRAESEFICRAWVDGFTKGVSTGSDKWFKQYMDIKQKVRQLESVKQCVSCTR